MDIEKAFPNQQSIDAHFPDRTSTIIVGLDPSEAVTAAFCAVDPRDPVQVKNLTVKRSALYSPIMAHRTDLQWKKTLQGIADIEEPLPSSKLASAQECKERIQAVFRSYDDLFTFYSSKAWKRNDWERTKSFHAEKDWAVSGALNMVDKNRPCLFVVGSANFNTRTRLASLHDSFRGYFHLKATSMGKDRQLQLLVPNRPHGLERTCHTSNFISASTLVRTTTPPCFAATLKCKMELAVDSTSCRKHYSEPGFLPLSCTVECQGHNRILDLTVTTWTSTQRPVSGL
ncbi:hypothetical protein B0O80DRAFT_500514 [Mortierella sp. GBAus27b]|nr:hypothetical protein B0O80DRAFT_500514 [Mortierella sp. GBAus27b]